eukprot:9686997-Alexandrium_andersonii.AAC.1
MQHSRQSASLLLVAAALLCACWAPLSFVTGLARSAGRSASSLPRGSSIYEKTENSQYKFFADVGYF